MIFCQVPPVFLNKISLVKKRGGQKGLVREKHDEEGWQQYTLSEFSVRENTQRDTINVLFSPSFLHFRAGKTEVRA